MTKPQSIIRKRKTFVHQAFDIFDFIGLQKSTKSNFSSGRINLGVKSGNTLKRENPSLLSVFPPKMRSLF